MESSVSKFWQPFIANCVVMSALVIWYFASGFGEIRPSDPVIQASRFQLQLAHHFTEAFAYERLIAAGDLEAAQLESRRLADWKEVFPWEPTIDPAVPFDPNLHILAETGWYGSLKSVDAVNVAIARHNVALRRFFQKDVRFTKQFEQTYHVFADYGRTNNPVYLAKVFDSLAAYQQAAALAELHPHEIAMRYWVVSSVRSDSNADRAVQPVNLVERWKPFDPDHRTGKTMTWQERADFLNDKLLYVILRSQWLYPQSFLRQETESRVIRDRLIAEVENMTEVPRNAFYLDGLSAEEKTLGSNYWKLMESGHPDLTQGVFVPFVGWAERLRQYVKRTDTGGSETSIWSR